MYFSNALETLPKLNRLGAWMAESLAREPSNPRSCGLAGSNPDRRSVARPSLPPGLR